MSKPNRQDLKRPPPVAPTISTSSSRRHLLGEDGGGAAIATAPAAIRSSSPRGGEAGPSRLRHQPHAPDLYEQQIKLVTKNVRKLTRMMMRNRGQIVSPFAAPSSSSGEDEEDEDSGPVARSAKRQNLGKRTEQQLLDEMTREIATLQETTYPNLRSSTLTPMPEPSLTLGPSTRKEKTPAEYRIPSLRPGSDIFQRGIAELSRQIFERKQKVPPKQERLGRLVLNRGTHPEYAGCEDAIRDLELQIMVDQEEIVDLEMRLHAVGEERGGGGGRTEGMGTMSGANPTAAGAAAVPTSSSPKAGSGLRMSHADVGARNRPQSQGQSRSQQRQAEQRSAPTPAPASDGLGASVIPPTPRLATGSRSSNATFPSPRGSPQASDRAPTADINTSSSATPPTTFRSDSGIPGGIGQSQDSYTLSSRSLVVRSAPAIMEMLRREDRMGSRSGGESLNGSEAGSDARTANRSGSNLAQISAPASVGPTRSRLGG